MKTCLTCKNARTRAGSESGSNTDRAFCGLMLDEDTQQPVACEFRRFAKPEDDECGPDARLWEPK